MKSIICIAIILVGCSLLQSQSIPDLIQIAATNNLELKTLDLQYRAALERAPQYLDFPDLEISAGIFPLPVETRLGGQRARLSAMQMFPQRGIRQSRADLENAKAAALYERIAARQLNLRYEIEQAYFKLYELMQSQAVIRRNIELLESLERIALAKVESGSATAADVLRVQLKTNELQQELTIIKNKEIQPRTTINQLLNRSLDTPIQVTDTLTFAQIPYNLDTFAQNITKNHPLLNMFKRQQEVARQTIEVSNRGNQMTFGVGADYILVTQRNDAEPSGNGRDIVQLKGTVKIPLFTQKYAAKEREELLNIQALENQKKDILQQFLATIQRAYVDYETAQLQLDLYRQQMEVTRAVINILQTNYSAQGNRFDELLRLETDLVNYDLKILKTIVQSHMAKSSVVRFFAY